MLALVVNGSPRKTGNTAELVKTAGKAFRDHDIEVEYIDLYDHLFKGCISCFSCQRKDSTLHGKCAYKDEASPILEKMNEADFIVLGTPIYLHSVNGMMHSLLERFLYANMYRREYNSKKVPSLLIYTMGATSQRFEERHYQSDLENLQNSIGATLGTGSRILYSLNCSQHRFPERYRMPYTGKLTEEQVIANKQAYKEEHFPIDCSKVYELTEEMISDVQNSIAQ